MLLKDVGEFTLLKDHIFPIISEVGGNLIGDDCAFLPLNETMSDLVITTDAGPKPLVMSLGYQSYYAWGWYTISVNVSDLASAGAQPFTLSLSIDAPSEMQVNQIEELYKGIRDACKHFNISLSGGNIRASKIFATHCTAIGFLKKDQTRITRKHCLPDDILVSIGYNGRFISTYLKGQRFGLSKLSDLELDILIKPDCEIAAMQDLAKYDFISSASDNSDGILGSVKNIADASNCGFEFDLDQIKLPHYIMESANFNNLNPFNLFFFWGDWQVIATVKKNQFSEFMDVAKNKNITYTKLGRATSNGNLTAVHEKKIKGINLLRNENFTELSFNNEISNHVDYLLKSSLFNNEN